MADASDYLESNLRDWYSQGTDMPSAPGTVHVALHTGAPGDDGASNEVTGGSYAREATTAGTDWNTPANGQFANANQISFTQATANWGTVTHASIWDAATGGNCLAVTDLDADELVESGDTFVFNAGDLSFTID